MYLLAVEYKVGWALCLHNISHASPLGVWVRVSAPWWLLIGWEWSCVLNTGLWLARDPWRSSSWARSPGPSRTRGLENTENMDTPSETWDFASPWHGSTLQARHSRLPTFKSSHEIWTFLCLLYLVLFTICEQFSREKYIDFPDIPGDQLEI